MWLKIISGISQMVIVVLAVFLLADMTSKQTSTSALEALKVEMNEKLEKDREYYTRRIDSLKEELQTYQQTREGRAKSFADRMEKLELLVSIKNQSAAQEQPQNDLKNVVESNLMYLEGRINGVAEVVTNNYNEVSARVSIIENRNNSVNEAKERRILNSNIINNNVLVPTSNSAVTMPAESMPVSSQNNNK